MTTRSVNLSLAMSLAAGVLAGGALALWFVQWHGGQSHLAGLAAAGTGLALAAAGTVLTLRSRGAQLDAVERWLDCVAQLDYRDAAIDDPDSLLPAAPLDHQLGPALTRASESYVDLAVRLAASDQARAAQDIRCRRQAAESERIKSILARLPEPVLVIDRFDELILSNQSADELFHLANRSTEERALARLVRCEQLVDLLCDTRRRKAATTKTDEVELPTPEGECRWYSIAASNLPGDGDDEGGSQGAVAVLRDVTNQKAAQKRNAEFVSAASHEMKAPLAGIKAYVELLADGDVDDQETRDEFLKVINGQADRLQRLIENLLNLARIEAGVVQVKKKHRSLNELLQEAMDVVQPSAERKNIRLIAELSPMYLGVLADRDMLLQAAINLLSNAIKYTPENGRVTLRSRMVDKEVLFEVEDTGVGLSPEDCDKVFEKFYRVEKDSKMAAGTGLGLPLAKHIVEDVHQGRLTVRSQLGAGSTFTITLPGAVQMS